MRNWNRVLVAVVACLCVLSLHGEDKTAMELLINKQWHLWDSVTHRINEKYFVCFTGTQRLVVSMNDEGEVHARIQDYYLSDKPVEAFDTAKVGKVRDGKYLVYSDRENLPKHKASKRAFVCLKITNLTNTTLAVEVGEGRNLGVGRYVAGDGRISLANGEEVSRTALLNKTWRELNPETGESLERQELFMTSAVLKSEFHGDRRKIAPVWDVRGYYFSDSIPVKFDNEQPFSYNEGRYLVIDELNDRYKREAVSYEINRLIEDTLEIECKSHPERGKRLFAYSLQEFKRDSTTTKLDRLSGTHWYFVGDKERMTDFVYITDTQIISSEIKYVSPIGWILGERTGEYYLAPNAKGRFDETKVGTVKSGQYVRFKALGYSKSEQMRQNWVARFVNDNVLRFEYSTWQAEVFVRE